MPDTDSRHNGARHLVIAGRLHAAGIDKLHARPDVTWTILDPVEPDRLAAALVKADALIIRTARLTAAAVDGATRLRVVCRHGVGYDNLAMDRLTARRIPVAVVGDVNAVTVAEQALAFMLALGKKLPAHDAAVRRGDWQVREDLTARELWRKKLLLLGFGRVARQVAQRAHAFGMVVLAHDPFVPADSMAAAGVRPAGPLDDALAAADIVSLHLPLTAETAGLMSAARLARLQPEALLVNTARGGLIDEMALDAALRAGRLAGAALDCLADEPPRPDNPLLTNDRLLLSPHIGGLTLECAIRMATVSVDNALAGLDGRLDPALVVNREVMD